MRLARWRDYPYFFETLEEYGATIPVEVRVSYERFSDFTRRGFDDEDDWTFVDEVADRMRGGEDIPPLIRGEDGRVSDGVHRAFAAKQLGIRTAPVLRLSVLP